MILESLQDLFIFQLKDLADTQRQLTDALPQFLPVIQSDALKTTLAEHLKETHEHRDRVEKLCLDIGIEPAGRISLGIEGLLEDTIGLVDDNNSSPTLDAALIAALQKMEHYKIAGYGTAAAYAKELKHEQALAILLEMLESEKTADRNLSHLAEGLINREAEAKPGKYAM